ncbi:MAG: hypothetical protein OHK0022_14150 [Roseiflexaceae bacterium]
MTDPKADRPQRRTELEELERLWSGGKLSSDELLGELLRFLVRRQAEPQRSEGMPQAVLGVMLHSLCDTLDALTGQQLDLWRVGELWFWRWEDTRAMASHGLTSMGEALGDAIEQRYPRAFVPPAG